MIKTALKRISLFALALMAVAAIVPSSVSAAPPPRGMLYLDGATVRTIGLPAAIPQGGSDPIFVVTNGVSGQLGVAGVGPGDPGFNGGAWAVYTVTFNEGVTPYLLTSDEAVADAEDAGDVTVTRHPELDNRCPVLK
jgi:hypothetical protein